MTEGVGKDGGVRERRGVLGAVVWVTWVPACAGMTEGRGNDGGRRERRRGAGKTGCAGGGGVGYVGSRLRGKDGGASGMTEGCGYDGGVRERRGVLGAVVWVTWVPACAGKTEGRRV